MKKYKQTPHCTRPQGAAVVKALVLIAIFLLNTCNNGLNGLLELQREMFPVRNYEELLDAVNGAPDDGQPRVIGVVNDIILNSFIEIGDEKNITLTAFDSVVYITSTIAMKDANFFYIEDGGSLTLGDKRGRGTLILDGGKDNSRIKPLITVGSSLIPSAALIMNNMVILQNNIINASGGAVSLNYNSIFIMNGGIIRDNHAKDSCYGGGIYMADAVFTINGGEIINNSAENYGGGIYMVDAIINMNGGTITGNTANAGGGGVFVGSGARLSVFTMKGGKIFGNNPLSDKNNIYIGAFNSGQQISASIFGTSYFINFGDPALECNHPIPPAPDYP